MDVAKNRMEDVILSFRNLLQCSICLQMLVKPVAFSCRHDFCRKCVYEYLKEKSYANCPICNSKLIKKEAKIRDDLSNISKAIMDIIYKLNLKDTLPLKISSNKKSKKIPFIEGDSLRVNCVKRRKNLNNSTQHTNTNTKASPSCSLLDLAKLVDDQKKFKDFANNTTLKDIINNVDTPKEHTLENIEEDVSKITMQDIAIINKVKAPIIKPLTKPYNDDEDDFKYFIHDVKNKLLANDSQCNYSFTSIHSSPINHSEAFNNENVISETKKSEVLCIERLPLQDITNFILSSPPLPNATPQVHPSMIPIAEEEKENFQLTDTNRLPEVEEAIKEPFARLTPNSQAIEGTKKSDISPTMYVNRNVYSKGKRQMYGASRPKAGVRMSGKGKYHKTTTRGRPKKFVNRTLLYITKRFGQFSCNAEHSQAKVRPLNKGKVGQDVTKIYNFSQSSQVENAKNSSESSEVFRKRVARRQALIRESKKSKNSHNRLDVKFAGEMPPCKVVLNDIIKLPKNKGIKDGNCPIQGNYENIVESLIENEAIEVISNTNPTKTSNLSAINEFKLSLIEREYLSPENNVEYSIRCLSDEPPCASNSDATENSKGSVGLVEDNMIVDENQGESENDDDLLSKPKLTIFKIDGCPTINGEGEINKTENTLGLQVENENIDKTEELINEGQLFNATSQSIESSLIERSGFKKSRLPLTRRRFNGLFYRKRSFKMNKKAKNEIFKSIARLENNQNLILRELREVKRYAMQASQVDSNRNFNDKSPVSKSKLVSYLSSESDDEGAKGKNLINSERKLVVYHDSESTEGETEIKKPLVQHEFPISQGSYRSKHEFNHKYPEVCEAHPCLQNLPEFSILHNALTSPLEKCKAKQGRPLTPKQATERENVANLETAGHGITVQHSASSQVIRCSLGCTVIDTNEESTVQKQDFTPDSPVSQSSDHMEVASGDVKKILSQTHLNDIRESIIVSQGGVFGKATFSLGLDTEFSEKFDEDLRTMDMGLFEPSPKPLMEPEQARNELSQKVSPEQFQDGRSQDSLMSFDGDATVDYPRFSSGTSELLILEEIPSSAHTRNKLPPLVEIKAEFVENDENEKDLLGERQKLDNLTGVDMSLDQHFQEDLDKTISIVPASPPQTQISTKKTISQKTKTSIQEESDLQFTPLDTLDISIGSDYLVSSPNNDVVKSKNKNLKMPSMDNREIVLITSGLSAPENELVKHFVARFHLTHLPKYSPETTHVIVRTDSSLRCERTLKYFQGVAGKKWIMSQLWLKACLAAKKILPEEEFEVQGDTLTEAVTLAPQLSRRSPDIKLLIDFDICCFGNFTPDLPLQELKQLLGLCGARLIPSPSLFKPDGTRRKVVIAQTEANVHLDSTRYSEFYRKYHAFPVSREWIFDCIALYGIVPLVHYLHCSSDILCGPDVNYVTKLSEE